MVNDGLARLRGNLNTMMLAGGEDNHGMHEFKLLLDRDCYDILQPDALLSEGVFQLRKVAGLAEAAEPEAEADALADVEALAEAEKETYPAFRLSLQALAFHSLKEKRKSDAVLAELIAQYQSTSPYQIAQVYAYRGDVERAFE